MGVATNGFTIDVLKEAVGLEEPVAAIGGVGLVVQAKRRESAVYAPTAD